MMSLLLAAAVMGSCNDCSYYEQIIDGYEQQLQDVESDKAESDSMLAVVGVQIRVADLAISRMLQTPISERDDEWENTFYGVVSHRNNLSEAKDQLETMIGSAEYAIADLQGMIAEYRRLIDECDDH